MARGRRTERGMQLAFGWRMACGRYVVCAGQFPARKRLAGTTNADMSFLWDGFGLQNGTPGRQMPLQDSAPAPVLPALLEAQRHFRTCRHTSRRLRVQTANTKGPLHGFCLPRCYRACRVCYAVRRIGDSRKDDSRNRVSAGSWSGFGTTYAQYHPYRCRGFARFRAWPGVSLFACGF